MLNLFLFISAPGRSVRQDYYTFLISLLLRYKNTQTGKQEDIFIEFSLRLSKIPSCLLSKNQFLSCYASKVSFKVHSK